MSKKHKIFLFLLAGFAAGIILISTSTYGAGLWPDATKYVAEARNLLAGNGFFYQHGIVLVRGEYAEFRRVAAHPPLFPIVLAFLGGILNSDPLVGAPVANAIIFGLIVYLSGLLAMQCFPSSPGIALLASVAALTSVPIFTVSALAATEPLFIFFVLAALLFWNLYSTQNSARWLVLLTIAAGLASITRYIGVTLLIPGLVVVLFSRRKDVKTKIVHLLLFLTGSLFPLGLWLIRNYVLTGQLFFSFSSSRFTLADNLFLTFSRVLKWFIPFTTLRGQPVIVAGLLAIAVLLAGLYVKNNWENIKRIPALIKERGVKIVPTQILLLALFAFVYLSFLVITATVKELTPIDNRYLSPVYVSILLIALYLFQNLLEPLKKRFSHQILSGVFVISICLWLLYPAAQIAQDVNRFVADGVPGYNDRKWQASDTIQYALGIDKQSVIYSNDPDAFYVLLNVNARWSPIRNSTWFSTSDFASDVGELKGIWPPEDTAYLIWFNQEAMDPLFSPDELERIVKLEPIAQLEDGTVYKISR